MCVFFLFFDGGGCDDDENDADDGPAAAQCQPITISGTLASSSHCKCVSPFPKSATDLISRGTPGGSSSSSSEGNAENSFTSTALLVVIANIVRLPGSFARACVQAARAKNCGSACMRTRVCDSVRVHSCNSVRCVCVRNLTFLSEERRLLKQSDGFGAAGERVLDGRLALRIFRWEPGAHECHVERARPAK